MAVCTTYYNGGNATGPLYDAPIVFNIMQERKVVREPRRYRLYGKKYERFCTTTSALSGQRGAADGRAETRTERLPTELDKDAAQKPTTRTIAVTPRGRIVPGHPVRAVRAQTITRSAPCATPRGSSNSKVAAWATAYCRVPRIGHQLLDPAKKSEPFLPYAPQALGNLLLIKTCATLTKQWMEKTDTFIDQLPRRKPGEPKIFRRRRGCRSDARGA